MIHIDLLRQFLEPESSLGRYRAPMAWEDQLVFTDGRIMVSVPATGHSLADAIPCTVKHLSAFQQRGEQASPYFPLQVTLPDPRPCPSCEGTGKVTVCSYCEGQGCIQCNETGTVHGDDNGLSQDCFNCDGTGQDPHQTIPIGNTTIARRYVALMLQLPGIEYHTPARLPNEWPMVSFRFQGGWGAVMPCVERP